MLVLRCAPKLRLLLVAALACLASDEGCNRIARRACNPPATLHEKKSETDGDDDHRRDQCRDPYSTLRQTTEVATAGWRVRRRRGLRCINRAVTRSAFRDRLASVAHQRRLPAANDALLNAGIADLFKRADRALHLRE